jgi:hypothetical protein
VNNKRICLLFLFVFVFSSKILCVSNANVENILIEAVPKSEVLQNLVSDVFDNGSVKQEIVVINPTEFDGYGSDIKLVLPETDLITVKSRIKIKGSNRYLTDVFVNGKKIEVRNDGRFFYDFELPKFGKQVVYVTFTTPDYGIVNVKRKIIRLYSPSDIDSFSLERKMYVYFFNIPYIYDPAHVRKLGDYLTRADLANFILMKSGANVVPPDIPVFEDVPEDYWAADAIQYVVDNSIMLEFPDGNFKPDRPVSKIEYIIALVRAGGYPLDRSKEKLPYNDVDVNHWTAKFIRAARNHKFIPDAVALRIHDKLTLSDFILLIKDFSFIQEEIADLLDYNIGFDTEGSLKEQVVERITLYLEKKKEAIAKKKKLDINTPQNNQIILGNNIEFKGNIFPSQIFYINDKRVLPDVDGKFRLLLAVEYGQNDFKIKALGEERSISVFALKQYKDLIGHWAGDTASKLRFFGVFEDKANFLPKKVVSRGEFASKLVKTFGLTKTEDVSFQPKDVISDDPFYDDILIVISAGILKGDNKGLFKSKKSISKAEALTAIVRACQFETDNSVADESGFPFMDVSKTHWVKPYLSEALKHKIVTSRAYFFPRKPLWRAELAAMLGKVPIMQKKFEEVFPK